MVKNISDRINASVADNIKKVPSLYRMMNRESPKAALAYATTLLASLEKELIAIKAASDAATAGANRYPAPDTQALAAELHEKTTVAVGTFFEQSAKQCTEQVELSYRSLNKLNKDAFSGNDDDLTKIKKQLELDIGEFKAKAEALKP